MLVTSIEARITKVRDRAESFAAAMNPQKLLVSLNPLTMMLPSKYLCTRYHHFPLNILCPMCHIQSYCVSHVGNLITIVLVPHYRLSRVNTAVVPIGMIIVWTAWISWLIWTGWNMAHTLTSKPFGFNYNTSLKRSTLLLVFLLGSLSFTKNSSIISVPSPCPMVHRGFQSRTRVRARWKRHRSLGYSDRHPLQRHPGQRVRAFIHPHFPHCSFDCYGGPQAFTERMEEKGLWHYQFCLFPGGPWWLCVLAPVLQKSVWAWKGVCSNFGTWKPTENGTEDGWGFLPRYGQFTITYFISCFFQCWHIYSSLSPNELSLCLLNRW